MRFAFARVCILYNGSKLREMGVHYSGDPTLHEDIEFSIDCFTHGLAPKTVVFMCFYAYNGVNSKRSIASPTEKFYEYTCNDYLKHGSWCGIKLTKAMGINPNINIQNIKKNKEKIWDPTLVELCKNKDVEGIKKYLQKIIHLTTYG